MFKHLPLLAVLLLVPLRTAEAVTSNTITLDFGPPSGTSVVIAVNDLNGTPLDGRSISIDFVFQNQFQMEPYGLYQILLDLDTDATGPLGFLPSGGTGYLVRDNGQPDGGTTTLARLPAPDGHYIIGIVGGGYLPNPIIGAHFDFPLSTVPTRSIEGAEVSITVQPLPEPSSLVLMALGLGSLLTMGTLVHWVRI